MATQAPVSVSATAGNDSEKGKSFLIGIVVGVAILCFLLGVGAGYGVWSNPAKLGNLQIEKGKVDEELRLAKLKIEILEARKPEQITTGMSTESCAAMAQEIVGKSCVGKPVAGPIRWRDNPTVVQAKTERASATATASANTGSTFATASAAVSAEPKKERDSTWDHKGGVVLTTCNFFVTDVGGGNRRLNDSHKVLAPEDDAKYCAPWIDSKKTAYLAALKKENPKVEDLKMTDFQKR